MCNVHFASSIAEAFHWSMSKLPYPLNNVVKYLPNWLKIIGGISSTWREAEVALCT